MLQLGAEGFFSLNVRAFKVALTIVVAGSRRRISINYLDGRYTYGLSMTSINTNASATAALETLRSISNALGEAQNQISTGYRVASASDGAAYWSIATTMRSENKALSAVQDTIGLGQAVLDVTYAGMNQVLEYMDEVKSLLVMASDEGPAITNSTWYDYERDPIYDATPLGKIDRQLRELFRSMSSTIDAASFNGVNLLKIEKGGEDLSSSIDFVTGISGSKLQTTAINLRDTVMINYNRSGDFYDHEPGASEQGLLDGKIDMVTYELTTTYFSASQNRVLPNGDFYIVRNGLWNYNNNPSYGTNDLIDYYNTFISGIDEKMHSIREGMATVGAIQQSLAMSAEFTKVRSAEIFGGVSRLVDTNMEEASARLQALQTQQKLSTQSLQISNSQPQMLLSLFQS